MCRLQNTLLPLIPFHVCINTMSGLNRTIPGLTNPPPAPPQKKNSRNRRRKKNKEENAHSRNNPGNSTVPPENKTKTFQNPEDLLSELRAQLQEARDNKDHATANVLRQRIWLLQDAIAGVASNISEEDMQFIFSKTSRLQLHESKK